MGVTLQRGYIFHPELTMYTDTQIPALAFAGEDPATDAERVKLCQHYQGNLLAFGRDLLRIVSEESGRLLYLDLTEEQAMMACTAQAIRNLGLPVRVIVDKARQIYASTLYNADGYQQEYFAASPHHRVLVTDLDSKTRSLFRANEYFSALMPDDWKPAYMHNHSNNSILYPESGALLEGFTARTKGVGRSNTIHYLHLSECAFYDNWPSINEGLLQTVPDLPGTTIIYESTANGFDQGFHPHWVTSWEWAQDVVKRWNREHPDRQVSDHYELLFREGYWDGSYFPLFFSWKNMKKYRRDPTLEGLTWRSASKVERGLAEMHGVTLENLAWRRYKIRSDYKGSRIYTDDQDACVSFQQEYPLTWEESFVTKSRSVFDRRTISIHLARTIKMADAKLVLEDGRVKRLIRPAVLDWKPGYEPRFDAVGRVVNRGELRVQATPVLASDLLVFRAPQTPFTKPASLWEVRYVLGVDIAEGLEQGDYSVIMVFDRVKYEFVAQWRGHLPPLEFAKEIVKLARYYDNAWIMGEYNRDGSTVVPRVLEYGGRCMGRPEIGGGIELVKPEEYWFQTTSSDEMGKNYAIERVRVLMAEKPTAFPFVQGWFEKQTYVRDNRGRMNAEGKRAKNGSKNYDDTIMAEAMALVGHAYLPAPMETRKPVVATKYAKRRWGEIHPEGPILPDGVKASRVL